MVSLGSFKQLARNCCSLLVANVILATIAAAASAPPLIDNIADLHCAVTEQQAQSALVRLKKNLHPVTGLPDEWEGTRETTAIHAGTLDLAIKSTIVQIERFPALTELGESVLLQWNYCDVFHNSQRYDIQSSGGELKRTRVEYQSPAYWDGLAMLGLGTTGTERYIPQAFRNIATTARDKLLHNWWDIQKHQCLPHPGNGRLFHAQKYIARAKVNVADTNTTGRYPVPWNSQCSVAEVAQQTTVTQPQPQPEPVEHVQTVAKPVIASTTTEKRLIHTVTKKPPKNPSRSKKILVPVLTADEAQRQHNQLSKRVAAYKRKKTPATKPQLAAALPPEPTPSIPHYPNIGAPPVRSDSRDTAGLGGSFALSNQGFKSDWAFTGNFSYKPLADNYYYAKAGFTLTENEEPLSYYWGIGYNDWHTGTWAVELNNWGPLKPGDGLQVENAIASLSYKFDSLLLKKNKLSSSMTLSAGKNNKPTLTLASSWAPQSSWFIRNLFTQPLSGGPASWSYGFGYNNWRSKTWALEYNNWGQNSLTTPNFKKNALLTLSWKWNL